jgi:hypothetical protein
MTTLRARWENPDYTGVIAEVPLGHVPHPKIFQTTVVFLEFVFSRVHPGIFWAVYSPVTGTRQIAELASFFRRSVF